MEISSKERDKTRLDSMSNITVSNLIDVSRWYTSKVDTNTNYFVGRGWFYYPKIKQKPMVPSEVAACIGHFMNVVDAGQSLHFQTVFAATRSDLTTQLINVRSLGHVSAMFH